MLSLLLWFYVAVIVHQQFHVPTHRVEMEQGDLINSTNSSEKDRRKKK